MQMVPKCFCIKNSQYYFHFAKKLKHRIPFVKRKTTQKVSHQCLSPYRMVHVVVDKLQSNKILKYTFFFFSTTKATKGHFRKKARSFLHR